MDQKFGPENGGPRDGAAPKQYENGRDESQPETREGLKAFKEFHTRFLGFEYSGVWAVELD